MEYTIKLLDITLLQQGGYPFAADDLTLDEWADLVTVNNILNPPLPCPMTQRQTRQ